MAGLTGDAPFGLLPVGGGPAAPPEAEASAVEAWWARTSGGRWRPRAVALPGVRLPEHPAAWCAGGGLGPGPRNAAGLARAALLALPAGAAAQCPPRVVLVVAGPVAPHAWRVAGGGVAVAPGRWVRRYAALPRGAPLGAWAHETAHLLADWPDLPGSPCLMGQGARRDGGRDPAPPGPALRHAAGWLATVPAGAAGPRFRDLRDGEAAALSWEGRALLVARTGSGAFEVHARDAPGPPLAAGRIRDPEAPVLAEVGAALLAARAAPPVAVGPRRG